MIISCKPLKSFIKLKRFHPLVKLFLYHTVIIVLKDIIMLPAMSIFVKSFEQYSKRHLAHWYRHMVKL